MYRYIVRGWVLYYNIRQVPTYVCCRCKRRARKYDNGAIYWRNRPVTDVIGSSGVVASLILTCTYITIQLGTRSAAEKRIHQDDIGLRILLLSLYRYIIYDIVKMNSYKSYDDRYYTWVRVTHCFQRYAYYVL